MAGRTRHVLAAAVVAFCAASSVSAAQQSDSIRARTLRSLDSLILRTAAIASRLPSTTEMTRVTLRAQPGNSVGSQSAWGAGWGDFFAGVGYQARARFSSLPDGSASFGFGLGNPRRNVGLEVGLNSASTFHQNIGKNGSVSLKLHRVLIGAYGVAVGVENAASWGGTDGGSSTYGVLSNTYRTRADPSGFFGSLALNVGVGNSRFFSQQDLARGRTGGVNAFGSVGVRLMPRASLIIDWTGQDLVAGLSLVPFRSSPLILSLGAADLTRRAGDGPRFITGLGAGLRLLR